MNTETNELPDGNLSKSTAKRVEALSSPPVEGYPECSGDPASCPENEGRGCCKPNPVCTCPSGDGSLRHPCPVHTQRLALGAACDVCHGSGEGGGVDGDCAQCRGLGTTQPPHQDRGEVDALARFTEYFVRNYPGPDTIIYDPKWHAPRIFRAAKDCITAALTEAKQQDIIEGEFDDETGKLSNWRPWRVFRDDDGALWLTTDDPERDIEVDDDDTAVAKQQGPGEAVEGFHAACDLFRIGSASRSASVLMANLNNVKRFADYLHAIESEFFMVPGTPDEDYPDDEPEPECLVNRWGSTREQYVEQFRAALAKLYAGPQARGVDHG